MPEVLTQYRVFIASPSGLEGERKTFRDTIRDYNEMDAERRGVTFKPMGWEATLGRMARPQSLINDEIVICDYFVLLLWDRWGSRPDAPGESGYSSACEEEFELAVRCQQDVAEPMREVIIFFKGVEPKMLADPGEQLQKVQAFKKKLEVSKQHHFMTFDKPEELKKFLNQYLAQWVFIHEQD
ncbi:MAG: DUF4062 domain-containing protein [Pseudomonadota bacterium]